MKHQRMLVTTVAGKMALFCVVLFASGCATALRGTSQHVAVRTTPPGARVKVDAVSQGVTPLCLTLERQRSHVVELQCDGYDTQYVQLVSKLRGAPEVLGNLIFLPTLIGTPIACIVDIRTGAAFKLYPKEIDVILEKTPVRSSP